MLVGEAPGAEEDIKKLPFVGPAGNLLNEMLADAGLNRDKLALTNVFDTRPPHNEVLNFFAGKKVLGKEALRHKFKTKYLKPEHWVSLDRLKAEIAQVNPKVIVALGSTALWALTGETGISALRGTPLGDKPLVLPTFHPNAVMREYSHRPVVTLDLSKARRYAEEGYAPKNTIVRVPQSRKDLDSLFAELSSASLFSFDVETIDQQIECISFAYEGGVFCIPIWDRPAGSAWSLETELFIWSSLRRIFAKAPRILAHNSTYDLTYLRQYGVSPGGEVHDTTLLHHALQPEMKKSLGFLASLYLDNPEWKTLRVKSQKDVDKADE